MVGVKGRSGRRKLPEGEHRLTIGARIPGSMAREIRQMAACSGLPIGQVIENLLRLALEPSRGIYPTNQIPEPFPVIESEGELP